MTSAEQPAAVRAARAVEEAGGLDGTVNLLGDAFDALVGRRPALTATLQGTQLGHSLHPLLTDLPIGLWTASAALDLVGGPSSRAAADRLLGLGLLAVAPTALSGWADWSASGTRVRRVGVVHAALNSGAAVLFGASWLLRRAGHRGAGVAVAMVANLVVTGGGYLGGHMVYRLGAPTGGPMATRHPAQEVVPRAPLRAA
ncbi:MAG: hypothetical protein BGO37_14905 [Cellulomonas sp. 73-92]|uniref:DUF2231 domain-containing protein n=1 Tax=Cellulomonas sp. 73-92 TaxID=1895740 RepID=UPI000927C8C3|nr:DUF2231 domain-containing protein [Cellulomonas sp. 73-92]OJV80828.1 MAG: hypothetical protein BGO37_14905 [Cellulomonas sp. 73-92]